MRTIATVLAVVSLLCVGLVLLGQGGDRSTVAAVTCAIAAVAFAILSLGERPRSRGREGSPAAADSSADAGSSADADSSAGERAR